MKFHRFIFLNIWEHPDSSERARTISDCYVKRVEGYWNMFERLARTVKIGVLNLKPFLNPFILPYIIGTCKKS